MAGRTDGLIKSFRAAAAVLPRRIVRFAASDQEVAPAAAATDALLGVTLDIDAAVGERVDVALDGIAPVRFGGPVTRGLPVTSDAQGRAVLAAPAAGVRQSIIGFAFASAVLDDIAPVRIAPGFITG